MLLRVFDTALFEELFGNSCVSHWDGDHLIVDLSEAGDPIEASRFDEAIEKSGIRCAPYSQPVTWDQIPDALWLYDV